MTYGSSVFAKHGGIGYQCFVACADTLEERYNIPAVEYGMLPNSLKLLADDISRHCSSECDDWENAKLSGRATPEQAASRVANFFLTGSSAY